MSTRDEFDSPTTKFDAGAFDGSGFSADPAGAGSASLLADVEEPGTAGAEPDRWHAGLDIGLLVLRLGLGITMGAHGLQKLFGLFGGQGIDGFAQALAGMGYRDQTTLLAWITALAEVGGGVLLVLGLFTQLGAAAILGVAANIVYVKYQANGGFFTSADGLGFEYELFLGVTALALLFTGSGRAALDKNTPWRRKPGTFGVLGLLLAAAASTVVIVLFR
ncbi:DoxX family protein [Prauserella oleivorans]|uniref:DoxX family protein n=1 Tax=Prauserella oleivorans TaxID=1478153 RepID=A0ABW5W9P6_9PSEU